MSTSVKLAPANSIIFISDAKLGDIPEITRGRRLWWNESCVVVGCLAFMDGETEVTLGDAESLDPGIPAAFDGAIATLHCNLMVSTVDGEVMSIPTPTRLSRVRVRTNHPSEPDKILVGLG
jgi:hypothetical protein